MPVKKRRKPPSKKATKKTSLKAKKRVTKPKLKKPTKTKTIKPKAAEVVGIITHYFPHVKAGVLKLRTPLAVGDTIKIKGHTTNFTQVVTSMQINHVIITTAKKGQEIGLMVNSRVRRKDKVYKV